jgi:hypothetical protein
MFLLIDLPIQAGWHWLLLEAIAIPSLLYGANQLWTTVRSREWHNLSSDLLLFIGCTLFWAMIFAQATWIYFQHWEGRIESEILYRSGSKYRTRCRDIELRTADGSLQRYTQSGLLHSCPVLGKIEKGASLEKPSGSFRIRITPIQS